MQIQDLCQWPRFASVARWKVNFETILSTLSPIDQELYGVVIFPLTNYKDLVRPTRSKVKRNCGRHDRCLIDPTIKLPSLTSQ